MKVERNMDTPESRAFWESAEKAAEEVKLWPAWKRAGLGHIYAEACASGCDCHVCRPAGRKL